jgi:rhamnose utilization protein RhaD (predicted bifunctional aldolase and dehydrogenase)
LSHADEVLDVLVAMSRFLGDPARDYVILGEGNTSARIDEETFYVKASGTRLGGIGREGFVAVRKAPVLKMLAACDLDDRGIDQGLMSARVDRSGPIKPSVETLFHAWMLTLPEVNFVGHTHPTAVNAIMCSVGWRDAIQGRIFPDEIVYCGVAPAYLEYSDPGCALARALQATVEQYRDAHRACPKVILIQNHGMIALGATPGEVQDITQMYVKVARVLAGTQAFGGPHFFSEENVARLHTRPDEDYRRRIARAEGG